MIVNFYDDAVAVDDICSDLNNGEIVVIAGTRPKFREITDLVNESAAVPATALAVEDDGLVWHYYLLPANTGIDLTEANDLVVRAAKRWNAKGCNWPFSVTV